MVNRLKTFTVGNMSRRRDGHQRKSNPRRNLTTDFLSRDVESDGTINDAENESREVEEGLAEAFQVTEANHSFDHWFKICDNYEELDESDKKLKLYFSDSISSMTLVGVFVIECPVDDTDPGEFELIASSNCRSNYNTKKSKCDHGLVVTMKTGVYGRRFRRCHVKALQTHNLWGNIILHREFHRNDLSSAVYPVVFIYVHPERLKFIDPITIQALLVMSSKPFVLQVDWISGENLTLLTQSNGNKLVNFNTDKFLNEISGRSRVSCSESDEDLQSLAMLLRSHGLLADLRRYQLQGISWMIKTLTSTSSTANDSEFSLPWPHFQNDESDLVVNAISNKLSMKRKDEDAETVSNIQNHASLTQGCCILADSMGLGKR